MKKLLAVVSCICLMFSLLSFDIITVNAATEGDYTYYITNGEAEITEVKSYISLDFDKIKEIFESCY